MKNKITIYDVAKVADVSPSTVSKALNGNGGAAETCRKIREAAEELGYRPNLFASGMRSSLKNCFGILVSKIGEDDPWLEKVLPAMVKVLSESKYRCMVDFWNSSDEEMPFMLDSVDGCILVGSYPERFFQQVERQYGLPLVTFAEKMPYRNGVSLKVDWQGGMQSIVQYLLACRHQHIGLVVHGLDDPSSQSRYDAFRNSMNHFECPVDDSLIGIADNAGDDANSHVNHVIQTSNRLTTELLKKRPEVSAIIYTADLAAFGGIAALHEAELKIPDDVSVASFDNTDCGRMMTPPLTSASLDYRMLSLRLLEALEVLLGKRPIMPDKMLPLELIKRDSVAVAPVRA